MGTLYRRTIKDAVTGLKQVGGPWWIKYHKDGRPYYESAKTLDKQVAKRLLKKREGDIATGTFSGVRMEKTRFEELAAAIREDYAINKVELHTPAIRPIFQRPGLEFRPVIHRDRARACVSSQHAIETWPTVSPDIRNPASSTGLERLQLSTTVKIRNGRPSARVSCTKSMLQRSVGPGGTGAGPRCRAMCLRRRTRMRSCNPSRRYKPTHALPIHQPAFAAQQHPNPLIPKPWPRVGQIANPQPQRRSDPWPTRSIPRRSTELRQPTGPRTADLEGALKPAGQLPAACGPQAFFRSASDSMCLSSERSATRRFSRAFSSSSCRSRRSSLTPRCAYFFFQA